ncbi:MAG: flagellar protein FlgN [Gammaproteobacteria bacterium]|nr:flagellar protein FlgN [Gammaproteobacteria bacterium]
MNAELEQSIAAVLDRQIAIAEDLGALLGVERAAITGPSPDALARSASDKIALLGTLERTDAERQRAFEAAGIDAAPPGDAASLPAGIARRWRALLRLAAECRRANELNGYLIRSRQHQVGQLLDALRGGSAGTYGRNGRASSTAATRPLAQV